MNTMLPLPLPAAFPISVRTTGDGFQNLSAHDMQVPVLTELTTSQGSQQLAEEGGTAKCAGTGAHLHREDTITGEGAGASAGNNYARGASQAEGHVAVGGVHLRQAHLCSLRKPMKILLRLNFIFP